MNFWPIIRTLQYLLTALTICIPLWLSFSYVDITTLHAPVCSTSFNHPSILREHSFFRSSGVHVAKWLEHSTGTTEVLALIPGTRNNIVLNNYCSFAHCQANIIHYFAHGWIQRNINVPSFCHVSNKELAYLFILEEISNNGNIFKQRALLLNDFLNDICTQA